MLVAVCGPSSCGKTTLIQSLQEKNIPTLNIQFARNLMKELNLSVQEIQSDVVIGYNFHLQLVDYKKSIEYPYLNSSQIHLTERSFLDIATFFIYNYFNEFIPQYINQLDSHTLIKECIDLTNQFYKCIIYLKNIPYLEDDGIRVIDEKFINNQKQIFDWLFSKVSIPILIVEDTDLKNRRDKVLTKVRYH